VEHYVGIDVFGTFERLHCGWAGQDRKEAKVASEPEALVYFFKELGFPVNRIGFEAGPFITTATWGIGRFHLRSERLQPDEGLRCALNLISGKAGEQGWDPARVRALRSKRVSQNTLITESQSSRKTTIDAFPFSVDVDQLRRITGTPTDIARFGSTVSGGISVHVKRPTDAHELVSLCRHLERFQNTTDYQRHFGWIDNVSPIKDPVLLGRAHDQITAANRAGQLNHVNLSPPSLISWDTISTPPPLSPPLRPPLFPMHGLTICAPAFESRLTARPRVESGWPPCREAGISARRN
jgi:hypothetical protein